MSKREVKLRLGTDEYYRANPNRVQIYNSNYGEYGDKALNLTYCWYVSYRGRHWGGGFPSQQDATDYVREELNNARVSV